MSYSQSRGYHRDGYRSTEIGCNPCSDLSYGNRQGWIFTARPSKRRRSDAPGRSDSVGDRWNLSQRRQEDADLLSRDEIERCSPSRKDGIDSALETRLRYSYCSYLQNLGMRLELPQTTIGTAAVLCHRFFFRRSHACHDRFLIATAALFLAAKSEETPCLLNTLLRASCEVCQHQEFAYLPYLFHGDWFEQYREQVTDAEQMILTTLDFELDVKHPYAPLTSVLTKLGLSHTVLFSVAWNLVNKGVFLEENNVLIYVNVLSWRIDNAVHGKHIFDSKKLRISNFWILLHDNGIQSSCWSLKMANRPLKLLLLVAYCLCPSLLYIGLIFEGLFNFGSARLMRLRSSLWLQFKPHHIAAGASFLAAKFLKYDLAFCPNFWNEFQTTPAIVQDVIQQLTEIF